MRLKSLTFEDKRTGWKLEDLRLDPFNLLVGASGVGKTRILRAILALSRHGRGSRISRPDQDIRFDVRFEQEGQDYTWQLDTTSGNPSDEEGVNPLEESKPIILREHLSSAGESGVLIEREQDRFLFRNKELPMLNRSTSALLLLEEPVIERLRHAFGQCFLETLETRSGSLGISNVKDFVTSQFPTLESLRSQSGRHSLLKAFVLQDRFPDKFETFKQLFIDIFPTVEDVSVVVRQMVGIKANRDLLAFQIKERGVPNWIEASNISSGMNRTLHHIVDLMLAPAGTVILIDEFENSLGVNCMGPLTDLILSRANELQFIITSHHPYIINNIPKDYWKVVRRKGSTVHVTPASEIAALRGPSSQEDFIRLLNSPEFEEGLG